MKILELKMKNGSVFIDVSTDDRLYEAALKIVETRLKSGDYYESRDATIARSIVKVRDSKRAFRFLDGRKSYEYEGFEFVELTEIDDIPNSLW